MFNKKFKKNEELDNQENFNSSDDETHKNIVIYILIGIVVLLIIGAAVVMLLRGPRAQIAQRAEVGRGQSTRSSRSLRAVEIDPNKGHKIQKVEHVFFPTVEKGKSPPYIQKPYSTRVK